MKMGYHGEQEKVVRFFWVRYLLQNCGGNILK